MNSFHSDDNYNLHRSYYPEDPSKHNNRNSGEMNYQGQSSLRRSDNKNSSAESPHQTKLTNNFNHDQGSWIHTSNHSDHLERSLEDEDSKHQQVSFNSGIQKQNMNSINLSDNFNQHRSYYPKGPSEHNDRNSRVMNYQNQASFGRGQNQNSQMNREDTDKDLCNSGFSLKSKESYKPKPNISNMQTSKNGKNKNYLKTEEDQKSAADEGYQEPKGPINSSVQSEIYDRNDKSKVDRQESSKSTPEYYEGEIQKKNKLSRRYLNDYKNPKYGPRQADNDFAKHANIELEISNIYNSWGHWLAKSHQYEEAIEKYMKADKRRSDVVDSYKDWSRSLFESNEEFYAEKIDKKAEEFKCGLKQIYSNWGWALSRLEKYEDAIRMYEKAIELEDKNTKANLNPKIYRNWGYTLSLHRLHAKAIEKYNKVIELDPEYYGIYTDMGYSYYELGYSDKAIKCYEKAIKLSSKDQKARREILYRVGKILDDKGEYDGAVKKFVEAIKIEEDINKEVSDCNMKCINRLGLLYYRLERYEEALNLFEKILRDSPRYFFVSIYIGLIYAQIEYRKKKQERYFDFSKNQEINPEENYSKLAHKYYNGAISKFEKGSRLYNNCIEAYEREITRNEEQLKKNLKDKDELMAVIAEMKAVLLKIMDLKLFSLDFPNALAEATREIDSEDNDPEFSSNFSEIMKTEPDKYDSSIISNMDDLIKKLEKQNPYVQIKHYEVLIDVNRRASKVWSESLRSAEAGSEKASKAYEIYSGIELTISRICNNLGFQLSRVQNYREAIEKYKESEETKLRLQGFNNKLNKLSQPNHMGTPKSDKKPNNQTYFNKELSGLYKNWGYAHTHLGEFDEAIVKFKEAIKAYTRNGLAYREWGYALSKQGKHTEAINKAEKALQYRPNDRRILINKAYSLTMLGKFEDAEQLCKNVLTKEEDTAVIRDAHYEWGNALDERGDLKGARDEFTRALDIEMSKDGFTKESNIKSLNRLGLIDYHQRNYEAALEKYNKILQENYEYGFAHINKGLVKAQAKSICLDKAVDLDVDYLKLSNVDQDQLINTIKEDKSLHNSYIDTYDKGVKSAEEKLKRLEHDAVAYKVTINELGDLLEKLKTLKTFTNGSEEHKENLILIRPDIDPKYEDYNEGIRIIQEKRHLKHDYVDVYEKELRKAKRRLNVCREGSQFLRDKVVIIKQILTKLIDLEAKEQIDINNMNQSMLQKSFLYE